MHNEPAFSKLIYEYLVLRFRFRYYQCGDSLPSIDDMCRKFRVSPLTVKAALKRLEQEHYVSIRHGKCTKVTYEQSDEAYDKFKKDFFAAKIPMYSDFQEALDLIFCPLYVASFQRMEQEDFTYLKRITERLDFDDLTNFYHYILQKTENPLALNLFWETALYLGFPSIIKIEIPTFYNVERLKEHMRQLIKSGQKKNPKLIYDSQHALERDITGEFIKYLAEQMPGKTTESVSFHWRIYRDRPQICYNLATRILHHIYVGDYRKDKFLPSYQAMAEKYQASVSTIRRTIRLLNEIGAVQSVNGKGTRILSLEEQGHEPNFSHPAVRRNLAYFIQAFELLKFSIEGVSRAAFPFLPTAEKNNLISRMETHLQTRRCELVSSELLACISAYCHFAELREVYEKLYRLMLWGAPLIRHRREASDMREMTAQFTKEMISSLKNEDFENCAKLLAGLFAQQYPIAEAYLYRQGMKPEELRLPPAISFMSASDSKDYKKKEI